MAPRGSGRGGAAGCLVLAGCYTFVLAVGFVVSLIHETIGWFWQRPVMLVLVVALVGELMIIARIRRHMREQPKVHLTGGGMASGYTDFQAPIDRGLSRLIGDEPDERSLSVEG